VLYAALQRSHHGAGRPFVQASLENAEQFTLSWKAADQSATARPLTPRFGHTKLASSTGWAWRGFNQLGVRPSPCRPAAAEGAGEGGLGRRSDSRF